jgi:hypothetical protein
MNSLDPYSQLDRSLGKAEILLTKKKDAAAASALITELADGPLKNDWSQLSELAHKMLASPESKAANADLALRLLERVVILKKSEDWMTWKAFAECYAAKGDWDKAVSLQTKVVQTLGGMAHDREQKILDGYRASREAATEKQP